MRTLTGRRRRRRSRGQAMIELAIAAPFLLLLLVGAAQFAYLAYAGISVQTAAREGARIAAENPGAVSPVPSCPTTPPGSGQSTGNAVCDAIYRGAGLLGSSNLTISVTAPDTTVSAVPTDVIQIDNPHTSTSSTTSSTTTAGGCNGNTVAVTGAVSPAQVASITDNGTNLITKTTLSDGTFTLCLLSENGSHSYTDTIYFTSQSCSATQVTQDVTVTSSGASPSTLSISLPAATCTSTSTTTTSTTASTSTSTTSTSSSTSSSSASSFSGSTGSFSCSGTLTGQYVTVSVSYDAPVFVPGLSWLLGSTHTMTATVTMRVESCDIQGGGG